MTLILETGSGVRTANSYVLPAFVTTYLTDRNRVTEASWSTLSPAQQEAACIAATDYVDTRWGSFFKGTRRTVFDGLEAQAQVTFSGAPSSSDTITLGSRTYTWVSSLALLGQDEILIGTDADASAANLVAAVNVADGAGTLFSTNLQENSSAGAAIATGTTDSVLFTAELPGAAGNDIPLSVVSASVTVNSTFVNGLDQGSQPLEFPRQSLIDQDGRRVLGIPTNLRQATAEYAVRAAAAALFTDPTVDATGRIVTEKSEKVGPIEERTKYEEGGAVTQLIKPYPAADRLLQDYVKPGGVVRG